MESANQSAKTTKKQSAKKPNNLLLKLCSLLLAVLLWFVIVNVDDPSDTKIFTQVPVSTQNESILANAGMVYQVTEGTSEVTVTVTAKRSVLSKVTKDDLKVIADFSNLELNTMVPITVSIPGFETKIEKAEALPRNMQITIEENESLTLPITVATTGLLQEGYFIESAVPEPSSVTVSGPKSLVDSISTASVSVDVSSLTESKDLEGMIRFFDKGGLEVNAALLILDSAEEGVSVAVNVMPVKEVPVNVLYSGELPEGYELTELSCEPQTVQIIGKQDALASCEELTTPASLLDLTDATDSITVVVDVADTLPEGISIAEGQSDKLMVAATIERAGTKTITFPVGSIVVNHAPEGCKVLYDGISEISLNFQGLNSALEDLKSSDLEVSIDLAKAKGPETLEVPVKVKAPEECVLLNEVVVKITLEEE